MAVTILVAGGYGELGKDLCPLLLDNIPGSTLVIAGRSLEKAAAYCSELNERYPNRATSARIDVGSLQSLETAPPFKVLINLITCAKVTGKMRGDAAAMAAPTARIMKFAVSRNAAYMDADPVPAWVAGVWKEVEKMMGGPVEPVVLCGAGLSPGVVGPMMKLAAAPLSKCAEAYFEIDGVVKPEDGAMDDLFQIAPLMRNQLLRDGVWQKAPMMLADKADMGDGKMRPRTPYHTADIEPLADELGCKTLGYVTAFDDTAPGTTDIMVGLLGNMFLGRCCPCLEGFFKARAKRGYAKNHEANPNLCLCQGRAIGTDAGGNARESVFRVSFFQGEHMLTAYCILGQGTSRSSRLQQVLEDQPRLQQVLDGTIKGNQPARLASWAADPARLRQYLKGCGPDILKIDEFCK